MNAAAIDTARLILHNAERWLWWNHSENGLLSAEDICAIALLRDASYRLTKDDSVLGVRSAQ